MGGGVFYLHGNRHPGVWPLLSLDEHVTIIEVQHLAPYLVRNREISVSSLASDLLSAVIQMKSATTQLLLANYNARGVV